MTDSLNITSDDFSYMIIRI